MGQHSSQFRKLAIRRGVFLFIAAAALTAAALPACAGGLKFGNILTETIDASNFSNVDIGGPFEATITRSDTFSVTISVQAEFRDYVTATKEGDTLRINLNPRHPFTNFPAEAKTFRAKVTMPALSRLQLSGATKATIADFKSAKDFRLDISGASALSMENIEAGNTEIQAAGASRIAGALKAKDIKADASGASRVNLKGVAESIAINASGASNLNLIDLPLNTASVKLSGASQAILNVKTKMDVALSDASRLDFQGNPTVSEINITGASTIRHR